MTMKILIGVLLLSPLTGCPSSFCSLGSRANYEYEDCTRSDEGRQCRYEVRQKFQCYPFIEKAPE